MKLRQTTIYILTALTVLLTFSACVDDYLYNKVKGKAEPGLPVELSLGIDIPNGKSAFVAGSRATTQSETERIVYDLYLFIFDAETEALKTKYFFQQISSKNEITCDPTYSTTGSAVIKRTQIGRGRIEHIHTTTGPSRIVAVANCNRKGSAMILNRLSQIENSSQLHEIIVSTIDPNSKQPDFEEPLTVMSGYYCDDDNNHNANHLNTPCEIATGNGDGDHHGYVDISTEPLAGTIWLTPLQSRIKFLITGNGHPAVTDPQTGDILIPEGRFDLESWQVINLPGSTPLFCRGYGDDSTPLTPNPVNSIVMTRFDSGTEVVTDDNNTTAGENDEIFGFNFFMADNHPGNGTDDILTYGDRAAWDSSAGVATLPTEKTYLNAPQGATYVILRGSYNGASLVTDESSNEAEVKNVTADVTYTIFLGHDSDTNFKDFNTYRNYNYTYRINVTGVNSITVEVNKDDEKRPDGEGHVITTNESQVILDSHYEQRVISVKKQNVIDAIEGGNFKMTVTVPVFRVTRRSYLYCDAEGNVLDEDPENALPYMDWVEFYAHDPSEENRRYIPYTVARGSGAEKATMTVKEFMADLYAYAHDPDDLSTEKTYTVYFGEYVYNSDPGNPENPVKWTDLLRDGHSRRFTMLGTTKFSKDHNSSYTTSGTTFVQRCMQTVYNVDEAGLERGWATECIEEDLFAENQPYFPRTTCQALPRIQNGSYTPTSIYGRQNCWRVNSGGSGTESVNGCWRWENLIDNQTGYFIPPTNQGRNINSNEVNLLSACLQRNRDENGNGLIDREEFKWYIPALEQMQTLYIGYGSLSDDVQIYNIQHERLNGNIDLVAKKYNPRHYLTSTHDKKVWAEEGLSVSPMGLADGTAAWNKDSQYYVRCIRTLGCDDVKSDGIPWNIEITPEAQYQPVYEFELYEPMTDPETGQSTNRYANHKRGKISMPYLNTQSVNNVARLTEIPGTVTTFTENNFPAYSFEWADTLLTFTGGNNDRYDKRLIEGTINNLKSQGGDASVCETQLGIGWRMPTITELTMIEWAWKLNNLGSWNTFTGGQFSYLVSRTEFSFKELGLTRRQESGNPSVGFYHAFDFDSSNAQFSLIAQSELNNSGNNKVPRIRCVRSYSSAIENAPSKPDTPVTSANQRKLHKK